MTDEDEHYVYAIAYESSPEAGTAFSRQFWAGTVRLI
jgi:hypothetical protein